MGIENTNDVTIDAVITWVDGSDVTWREKINTHLEKKIDWNNKISSKRYNSIDEIDIAIESIIKFAPFIRNIFLVTDNQQPKSFDALKEKAAKQNIHLKLVDHSVIFKDYETCLPTFNSCSIITMLYRIPEMAEHFVIFNDDTFLMRPTKVEDFFVNGLPVIRGRWDNFYNNNWFRKTYNKYFNKNLKTNVGYKYLQQKSAQIAGFKDKYVRRDHTPFLPENQPWNAFSETTLICYTTTSNTSSETTINLSFLHFPIIWKSKTKPTFYKPIFN